MGIHEIPVFPILINIGFRTVFSGHKSPSRTGTADCWPHVYPTCLQTDVEDNPASLEVTCGQHVESPVVFHCLDRNCCYKLVATQISRDCGLASIPYTGQKFFFFWDTIVQIQNSML